jgi:thiamine pyrophosphate-dependent acetolactate synthase large subunit-like protein
MGVNGARAETAEELDALLAQMVLEPGPHLSEALLGRDAELDFERVR